MIALTTVLALSGLVGGDTGPFRGQRNHPVTGTGPKTTGMAGPPHNAR